MDSPNRWCSRFRRAYSDLHDAKQKTRKEGLENVSTLIENPKLLRALNKNEDEWNHAFTAIKTLLYKEMGKLEEEIRKKGKEGPRSSAFPCECRDLLNAVVKAANHKKAVVNLNDYYRYVKETNPTIRKHCLENALTVFREYFILKDAYWNKMDLEETLEMKEFFKKLHEDEPNTKALRCYNALLQKGADYKLPLSAIRNEIDFIRSTIFGVQSSRLAWLLESAAELFLIFCQTCGKSYKQLCIVEGENVLFHLLNFFNPHDNQPSFKTILIEIMVLQLGYHQDCQNQMTPRWMEVLVRIGAFIKTCIDQNYSLAISHSVHGIAFNDTFVQIVLACYRQGYDAKLASAEVQEPCTKKARREDKFHDIFDNIDSHMEPSWVFLFSLIVEKYPEIVSQAYFTRLLACFSNYVKDCKSVLMRGYVFKCLSALIIVEEKLCENDKDFAAKTGEWLLVYDSAIRVIGLNQNVFECHMFLRQLLTIKHQMLSPEDAAKLWNLYASQTIQMNENSLHTLHTYSSIRGLRDNSIELKNLLIDFILQRGVGVERRSYAHFANPITAEVLVNLTFKYYSNALGPSAQAQPVATVINRECYHHLLNALTLMANDLLNKNANDYEIYLNCIYLSAGVMYFYKHYDIASNAADVSEVALRLMQCTWGKMVTLFGSLVNTNIKTVTNVLNLLMEVFKFDEKLGIINDSIELDFIQALGDAQCELETDHSGLNDPKVKLKMLIVEIFTVFALKADTETQKMVQLMLYEFEDFDPFSEVDYRQAMIILRGLQNQNGRLSVDSVEAVLTLLQRICRRRFNEYEVCVDILQILKNVFWHLIRIDDLQRDIKNSFLGIFRTLHYMRRCFGYKVELALVQCLDCLLAAPTLTWAKYNDDLLVLLLPPYLESEHLQVQIQTIQTLAVVYAHASSNSQVDKLKSKIFSEILRKLDMLQHAQQMDERFSDLSENFTDVVLELFSTIIVAAKSTKFAKVALGEIFVRSRMYRIGNDRLHSALKGKNIDINAHLNTILQFWCRKYSVLDFPYELFQYDNKKAFYLKNLPAITLIALKSNEEETLEIICNEIGKTSSVVLEESYSKFIAVNLIEQASEGGEIASVSRVCNVTFNNLTQVKYDELLSDGKGKQLMMKNIDDILVEIIKYVHDPAHFDEFFGVSMSIAKPEEDVDVVITHEMFCNEVMKLLEAELSCEVVQYLLGRPHRLQQVLLKLKCNIWRKVNVEDKLIEFYHYAIFVNYLLGKPLKDTFAKFVLREVIYMIINMIKYESATFQKFALKFMSTFIDLIVPKFTKQFSEFIIVTCSCLMPHAVKENPHALDMLAKIVFSDDAYIKSNLKYLDPLPAGKEHLRELRSGHMRYRAVDISLHNEIKLFLVGKQYKDSRTEGLKYLRERLKYNVAGLKNIYLELHEMRGVLSKDSVLHSLITTLVELVRSKDDEESMEALKCLGILGASDLTTMVLKSEDVVQTRESSSHLFTAKVLELLNGYLVDRDVEVARLASKALYAILSTQEGRNVLETERVAAIRPFLLPFLSKGTGKDMSLLSVTADLYTKTLCDNDLWCPEASGHDEWIKSLMTRIFEGFTHPIMACFIPIVANKATFAEECFPFLINLLLDTSLRVKSLVGGCIELFFEKHFNANTQQINETQSIVMNIASIRCMLNAIHFVRLQRLYDKKGKSQELDLDVNYLHVAKAAQYCSAHFSALMYSEKWYHSALNNAKFMSTYHGLSPFGLLDEIGQETSQLRSILTQAYKGIGDSYALFGGHLQDILDLSTPACKTPEHSLDFQLLRRDIQLETSSSGARHMINTLKDNALYNLAVITAKGQTDYGDAYNECMWRLSKWDLPNDVHNSNTFEFHVYNLLSAFNDDDKTIFDMWVKKSRLQVAQSLKNMSLESCKAIYSPLSELERLQELEDIFHVAKENGDLGQLVEELKMRDDIQSDYQYWEPRIAQRIEAINLLQKRNFAGAQDIYVDLSLNYADLSREHGNLQISKRVLSNFLRLDDPEINARVALLEAQIYWKLGHSSSISKLKKLLHTYDSKTRLRSTILKLCGEWMVENKSEFPQTILEEYFVPSFDILTDLERENGQLSEATTRHEIYKTLAKFADEEYQHLCKSIKSPEFERKVESMNKMKECVKKLSTVSVKSYDIKKAIVTYQRMTKIDEIDIMHKNTERDMFLKVAIKYYLHNLKYSAGVQPEVFRIFSLWLENKSNKDVIKEIEENLLQVESYKILTLLPQLVPHISTEEDIDIDKNRFTRCINNLIEKCGKQHPHHAIPLILCVANTNQDDNYTKDNAKTSSNECRIVGAQMLINRLRDTESCREIVEQNEQIAAAFTELAYHKFKLEKSPAVVKFPRAWKINSIHDFTEAMVPTYVLPNRPSLDYARIVGIHKFKQEFTVVGGVNAPKRLDCVGTDGITRYLLVKGQDDLRQDAVMQQVFGIMNELLRANKETLNFKIRTYKVVPLSKRSGVLEWVDNTQPLGQYLADAHTQYYPKDKSLAQARTEIKAAAGSLPAQRLKVYLKVCEKIRPVFHKFFETSFLEPTVWYEKRRAYTQSVATSSMCGYVLGIGDRHVQNILIDNTTAEVVHIDFGIAFEQGRILPTPETVPFRLTRDIVDGMGICGVEGTFRRTCEKTMEALRRNVTTIQTILEVLLYDPLYDWSISPTQAYSRQMDEDSRDESEYFSAQGNAQINVAAERALTRLKHKLVDFESASNTNVETQVDRLIQQAREPSNLSRLFCGWQAYL